MRRNLSFLISLAIGFIFTSMLWQIAEPKIVSSIGKAFYAVTKTSFVEIATADAQGIPMRYYPRVGTVYDPEYVALESIRNYNTRIEPNREKKFLQLSEWLVNQVDSTGLIPQNYDFRDASLLKPWYSAATQSAAMLAIAQRAGFLRDKRLLAISTGMLAKLDPGYGYLSSAETDSTVWFKSYPDYAIRGMVQTLLNLYEYDKMVKDPLAKDLFTKGVRMLNYKLGSLENRGYLDDPYMHTGRRLEHQELTSLLEQLNNIAPNRFLASDIERYKKLDKLPVSYQMLDQYAWGRIFCALLGWMLFTFIIHAFLKMPK